MKYHHLSSIDLPPSALCLGTATFGSYLDSCTAFQLLDAFFAHGGNFIDTAHVYGAWVPDGMGLSETIIGQWMKERGIRDKVIIATKGAHPDLATRDVPRLSRQEIIADLDESLRCLQTETIDLYWLHRDDPRQPVASMLETLNDQVTQGKIRAFGCSNWRVERIEEALSYTAGHGIAGFVGNQLMWSFAKPNLDAIEDNGVVTMDAKMLDFHQKTGLFIAAYTSQARGFFAKANHDPASLPDSVRKIYTNEENTKRLRRLQKIAQELSLSLSVVSLAYLINQPLLTFPIASYSSRKQLQESIEAGDVELSTEVMHYLEKGE